jgi:hypothetical protein
LSSSFSSSSSSSSPCSCPTHPNQPCSCPLHPYQPCSSMHSNQCRLNGGHCYLCICRLTSGWSMHRKSALEQSLRVFANTQTFTLLSEPSLLDMTVP